MTDAYTATTSSDPVQPIYPIIKTEQELQTLINSSLNDKNAVLVKKDIAIKQTQLDHYKKVLLRNRNIKTVMNYIFLVLGILLGITSTLLGYLIDYEVINNSLVTEVLDTLVLVVITPSGILINAFLSNRITKWQNVVNDITKCIDQVYILWLKAAIDGVITDDELTSFEKIFSTTEQQITTDESAATITNDMIAQVETIFTDAANAFKTLATTKK